MTQSDDRRIERAKQGKRQALGTLPLADLAPRPAESLDLSNCAREPIHIPGSIQPHGALLAVREPDLAVMQVSANSDRVLGASPEALLDQPLARVLGSADVERVRAGLRAHQIDANPLHIFTTESRGGEHPLDVIVHRYDSVLILEFEPAHTDPRVTPLTIYNQLKAASDALARTLGVYALCQQAAVQTRLLTGFDRVMVYQFAEDEHGVVVAEALRPDLDPYLGLHYPASDIPAQARALYLRNHLRLIADVDYVPTPIQPSVNSTTGGPLDLSYAVLRSVSPVHIQYLKNMGVASSMSISLVREGRLWGLIACHHTTPRYVPFDVRVACEFLGRLVAAQMGEKEFEETRAERERLHSVGQRLAERVEREPSGRFDVALTSSTTSGPATVESSQDTGSPVLDPGILDFIPAGGAAVCAEGTIHLLGKTPGKQAVANLLGWLAHNASGETYATVSLPRVYPPARRYKDVASGLLAVAVSREQQSYVLWFRPEVIQTVAWGGDPIKPVATTAAGAPLTPRSSFAAWKQTVRLTASPWEPWEVDAAEDLSRALRVVAMRRAVDGLTRLNAELDEFAYIVSHDLKEPLRGIKRYAQFLSEDYAHALDAAGAEDLATLRRLSERLERQIDALLRYSRLGRSDVLREDVDVSAVVAEQVDLLSASLRAENVSVRIREPLPHIRANRAGVGEVIQNLLTNAIKYNDKSEKWIEIGQYVPPSPPDTDTPARRDRGHEPEHEPGEPVILYVRDNGIGIAPEHREAVFQMFRRLHEREAYGGGTGAGLALVRKIVERHGGGITLDSEPGQGTTFYVTLSPGEAGAEPAW